MFSIHNQKRENENEEEEEEEEEKKEKVVLEGGRKGEDKALISPHQGSLEGNSLRV